MKLFFKKKCYPPNNVLFGGENSNPPDDGGKDKILGLQLSARLQNNGLKDKIFLGLELIARLQHRTRGLRHLTRIHGVFNFSKLFCRIIFKTNFL